jgi:hypothetical protein
VRNLDDLREVLFETIADLRAKKITVAEADSVCVVAKRLIETAEVELKFLASDRAAEFVPSAKAQPKAPLAVRHQKGEWPAR